MKVVKAYYKNGRIDFLEPIPANINKAKLIIVIDPEENDSKNDIPMEESRVKTPNSEEDFKLLGLRNFFATEDDEDLDWEVYFGLK